MVCNDNITKIIVFNIFKVVFNKGIEVNCKTNFFITAMIKGVNVVWRFSRIENKARNGEALQSFMIQRLCKHPYTSVV